MKVKVVIIAIISLILLTWGGILLYDFRSCGRILTGIGLIYFAINNIISLFRLLDKKVYNEVLCLYKVKTMATMNFMYFVNEKGKTIKCLTQGTVLKPNDCFNVSRTKHQIVEIKSKSARKIKTVKIKKSFFKTWNLPNKNVIEDIEILPYFYLIYIYFIYNMFTGSNVYIIFMAIPVIVMTYFIGYDLYKKIKGDK